MVKLKKSGNVLETVQHKDIDILLLQDVNRNYNNMAYQVLLSLMPLRVLQGHSPLTVNRYSKDSIDPIDNHTVKSHYGIFSQYL